MGHSTAAGMARSELLKPDLTVDAARNVTMLRLADSLLHDVRNPLNALSINLDVLTEKLKREYGEISPAQEKNLRVMREQIHRVDGILREYLEFMAPRSDGPVERIDLSDSTARAVAVLGHECRRAMIRVRQLIEPDLKVAGEDPGAVRFLLMQIVFRAVARAGQEGEIEITLQREGGSAVLRVRDSLPEPTEPFEHAVAAVGQLCAQLGAELRSAGSEVVVFMPLKLEG